MRARSPGRERALRFPCELTSHRHPARRRCPRPPLQPDAQASKRFRLYPSAAIRTERTPHAPSVRRFNIVRTRDTKLDPIRSVLQPAAVYGTAADGYSLRTARAPPASSQRCEKRACARSIRRSPRRHTCGMQSTTGSGESHRASARHPMSGIQRCSQSTRGPQAQAQWPAHTRLRHTHLGPPPEVL